MHLTRSSLLPTSLVDGVRMQALGASERVFQLLDRQPLLDLNGGSLCPTGAPQGGDIHLQASSSLPPAFMQTSSCRLAAAAALARAETAS